MPGNRDTMSPEAQTSPSVLEKYTWTVFGSIWGCTTALLLQSSTRNDAVTELRSDSDVASDAKHLLSLISSPFHARYGTFVVCGSNRATDDLVAADADAGNADRAAIALPLIRAHSAKLRALILSLRLI